MWKLQELIDKLNEMHDWVENEGLDPDETIVLVATQQSYPLTNFVTHVTTGTAIGDSREDGIDEAFDNTVWIATSQPSSYSPYSPYAPKEAWTAE